MASSSSSSTPRPRLSEAFAQIRAHQQAEAAEVAKRAADKRNQRKERLLAALQDGVDMLMENKNSAILRIGVAPNAQDGQVWIPDEVANPDLIAIAEEIALEEGLAVRPADDHGCTMGGHMYAYLEFSLPEEKPPPQQKQRESRAERKARISAALDFGLSVCCVHPPKVVVGVASKSPEADVRLADEPCDQEFQEIVKEIAFERTMHLHQYFVFESDQ